MTKKRALVMLVFGVILSMVLVDASPVEAGGYSKCVDGVQYNCSLNGGTLTCVASGECTSTGEPGTYTCTPGSRWSVLYCETSKICYSECQDGEYVNLGCDGIPSDMWVTYCSKGEKYCYSDSGGGPPTCVKENPTPCLDLQWGTAGIQCNSAYDLAVSVSVPCQRVVRVPYPRGMVATNNSLSLSPGNSGWAQSWSRTMDYMECLSYNLKDGKRKIRNYKVGLAWGRYDGQAPYWEIAGAGGGYGTSVSAVWDYSSFDQPECGPGLSPGETLPAFPGRVYTHWIAYWRITYERQRMIKECHTDGGCEERGDCHYTCSRNDDDIPEWGTKWVDKLCNTDDDGDGIPDGECWETKDTGWVAFDLREFGYQSWYFTSGASGPVATALEPSPGCNGFCIPVIEVQGVIENPREP